MPEFSIDLGVSDIYIRDNAGRIEFKGKGLKTNIGERLPGTSMGMTVGKLETSGVELSGEGEKLSSELGWNKSTKPKPAAGKPKKKKALSWWEYMTTLKGFRP